MRKPHQIELEPLIDWLNENECIYASSTAEKKKLCRSMLGCFKLYHRGELIWEGMQPYQAVEKYNDII